MGFRFGELTVLLRRDADTKPEDTKAKFFEMEQLSSFLFLQLSFEGVFWAVAGLGKIAVGTVLYGVRFAVAELVCHGVVAGLAAFVWLFGTLPAVGIVLQMVADTFCHGRPFDMRY
jgi:hypothetical protein